MTFLLKPLLGLFYCFLSNLHRKCHSTLEKYIKIQSQIFTFSARLSLTFHYREAILKNVKLVLRSCTFQEMLLHEIGVTLQTLRTNEKSSSSSILKFWYNKKIIDVLCFLYCGCGFWVTRRETNGLWLQRCMKNGLWKFEGLWIERQ